MNPKIFSEITGNTHGIKFKMMPPRKPKNRKVKIPRAGGAALAAEIVGATEIRHAARSSLFACWEKTTNPAIEERFFSDDSIGTLKITSFVLCDSIVGWPTTTSGPGNGKKSSAGYLSNDSLVIFSRRSRPTLLQLADATFDPGQFCGSKCRYRAKSSEFAG